MGISVCRYCTARFALSLYVKDLTAPMGCEGLRIAQYLCKLIAKPRCPAVRGPFS